jgi:hypothetical protein
MIRGLPHQALTASGGNRRIIDLHFEGETQSGLGRVMGSQRRHWSSGDSGPGIGGKPSAQGQPYRGSSPRSGALGRGQGERQRPYMEPKARIDLPGCLHAPLTRIAHSVPQPSTLRALLVVEAPSSVI